MKNQEFQHHPKYLSLSLRLTLFAFLFALAFAPTLFAQWEPDRRLTFDSAYSQAYPWNFLAAGPGGVLHVVWDDERDGNREIYYKRSTDEGNNWSADTRLTFDTLESWGASVSVSGIYVHVVWLDGRNGNWDTYYRRSTDEGVTWSPDMRLTSDPYGAWFPSAAVSGNNVHVVFGEPSGGPIEIYYMRSTDAGNAWSAPTRLTYDPNISKFPFVAVSNSNVHVFWIDDRDGNDEIYYKRSSDGGTSWSGDTRFTFTPTPTWTPCVSVLGANVHAVWGDSVDGNFEVYYRRSTDSGVTWSGTTRLTYNLSPSIGPSIFASGNNAHVVWMDSLDGNWEIYYKFSSDGGVTWSGDTRLTNDLNSSWLPAISTSGTDVHVVWTDDRNGNLEIYYKRNQTGNIGVEEKAEDGQRFEARLKSEPNPFTSFATVPGHERERFSLYDISGRKVGTYKGDRVGEGLTPGIYFLKPEQVSLKLLRIVKLR